MDFDNSQQIKDLASLPPEKPKPPERSAWSAIPKGIAGAAAQVAGQVQQFSAGIDERYAAEQEQRGGGARQAASARQSAEGLRTRGDQLIDFERGLRPDPVTATTAENVVYGLTKGLTKAIGSVVTMGPVAGAAAFGASEAASTYDDLTREGVDSGTALKAAGVAGVANAAGVALPMMGSTLFKTAALYVAGGPGGFMAQQQGIRTILERADYQEQAQKFDPFDPLGLVLSSLVPLPFAGYGAMRNLRAGKKGAPALPDQAQRGDQAPGNTEVAPAVSEAPAGRVAQEHIDAAMVHNLTLTRQAIDAQAPIVAQESARKVPSLAEFTASMKVENIKPPEDVKSDFMGWLQSKGGIDFAEKFDISGEQNAIRANPGGIFRKGGQGTDTLAWGAIEDGYLTPGAGAREFVELVQQAIRGEKVLTFEQQQVAAKRAGWESDMADHVATLKRRLELLGVDPEQAKGSAQSMEAYLRAHHDQLLQARLAEAADSAKADSAPDLPPKDASPQIDAARQAAQDFADSGDSIDSFMGNRTDLQPDVRNLLVGMFEAGKDSARADRMLADYARTVAQQRHRPTVDVAADVVEASRQGKSVTAEPVQPVATKPEEAAAQSMGNRLAEIQQQNPDMVVRITEDGKPVTVAEEMAALKREVAEGTDTELGALDADLVRVAAECALATSTL